MVRAISQEETPFRQFASIHIATIHLSRPSGESWKIVPTLTLNCFLHPLPTLLVRQPERIADLAAVRAEDFTIRPAHRRDFINANLLIAKVLNRVYESGGVFHDSNIPQWGKLVKYIITSLSRVDGGS